jgi:hypothetical protein
MNTAPKTAAARGSTGVVLVSAALRGAGAGFEVDVEVDEEVDVSLGRVGLDASRAGGEVRATRACAATRLMGCSCPPV